MKSLQKLDFEIIIIYDNIMKPPPDPSHQIRTRRLEIGLSQAQLFLMSDAGADIGPERSSF